MSHRFLFIPLFLSLAACDADSSTRQSIVINGHEYAVMQMRDRPTAFYAFAAERWRYVARPFAGVLPGNIPAIEAVTGCAVIPDTVRHLDGISTEAEVRC